MRLDKIVLENFGLYSKVHTIRLDAGLTFILGNNLDDPNEADSNSSGKTTILTAISWALFGKVPSKAKTGSLMHWGAVKGEKMMVQLRFNRSVTVTRTVTSKGETSVVLETPENGREIGDVAVINDKICRYFGVTYQLFLNCIYLSRSSGSVQFLNSTPAERAKVLSYLVDDSDFVRATQILKVNKTTEEHAYSKAVHEEGIREETIQQKSEKRDRLKQELAAVAAQEEKGAAEIKDQISRLEYRLNELAAASMAEPKDSPEKLEELRVQLKRRMTANSDEIAANQPVPHRLGEGERCSFCFSLVDYNTLEHIKKENAKRAEERKKLELERDVLRRDYDQIEKRQERLREWKSQQAERKMKLQETNWELAHAKRRLEEVRSGSVGIEERIKSLTEEIVQERALKTKATVKKNELAQSIHVASKLITMFTLDIRNLLFDQIRGTLEASTDKYVRTIAGNMVQISYPSTNKSGQEKFEILLSDGQHIMDLSAASEGLSWRATFAVLLALRDTLLERAKCRLGLLLIDDPIGVLDSTGTARYMEILRGLAGNKMADTLLVTVPKDEGVEPSDTVLRVTKKNKEARIL